MKIKYAFLLFLIFLLGAQTSYAKTELVLIQNQVSFSIEQSQSFKSLEKELQANVGFLKEKTKFVAVEGAFAERVGGKLAQAVGSVFEKLNF